jgi:hypothetical protein
MSNIQTKYVQNLYYIFYKEEIAFDISILDIKISK